MYLPIGGDMAVRTKAIVGIFGLDNTTTSLPANTACPGYT